jgi:prepilin-type N-terminal cleavage/methylation domain-containing protein
MNQVITSPRPPGGTVSRRRRFFSVSPCSCGGFTLLELIIVLFLSAIILSLAGVFFSKTLSSSKLNAAAREISATIRQAKSMALTEGEKQTVTINIDSREYGIAGRGSRSLPGEVQVMAVDPVAGEIRTGEYHITFQPYGGVEGGTVVLWNNKKTVSIQMDPVLGSTVIK